MKFIVGTYGTEGDARPFAALCRGLMDAGHEARLLADAATLGSAQALGVPATALSGDIRGALTADRAIAGVVAKGGGFNDTTRASGQLSGHRRHTARLALPAHRCGYSSRRFRNLALRGTRGGAFNRDPVRWRSVFWAERLRVAGVAPAAVDGRWPRAEAVVSALDFAADDRIRKHARVLGETMRSENGVWMQWRPLNASCGLDAQYAGRTADRNS